MTVSAAPPFNTHSGNGVTTVFAYGFKVLDATHLEVYLDSVIQTSGYTVAGVGADAGGSVTFSAAPANGVEVLLKRAVPLTRNVDFVDNGDFTAEDIDNDQDLQTMQIQDIASDAERAIKVPPGETIGDVPASADRAGKVLGFDALGEPVVVEVGASSDPSLRADLAAVGGAALVGFSLGGSVESKLKWPINARASGYTALKADHASLHDFAATGTLNLTAAGTLTNGWWSIVRAAAGATVTVDPAGAELVNGAATFTMRPGEVVLLLCTGTAFTAIPFLVVDNTRADSAGYRGAPQVPKDAAYTFAADDVGKEFLHNEVAARIWTIPANAAVPIPIGSIILGVNWVGAGALTIHPDAGVTLRRLDGTAGTGDRTIPANAAFALHKVLANEWGISGVFT